MSINNGKSPSVMLVAEQEPTINIKHAIQIKCLFFFLSIFYNCVYLCISNKNYSNSMKFVFQFF